jgi:hypothetical protein
MLLLLLLLLPRFPPKAVNQPQVWRSHIQESELLSTPLCNGTLKQKKCSDSLGPSMGHGGGAQFVIRTNDAMAFE